MIFNSMTFLLFFAGVEDLHALAPVGRVGHRKRAVNGHVERARFDQPSFFSARL